MTDADQAKLSEQLVEASLASWATPYRYSIVPAAATPACSEPDTEVYSYLVTWSRPTKERPVPSIVVNMTARVHIRPAGPSLSVSYERASYWLNEDEAARSAHESIQRLLDRKARILGDLDLKLVEPFDRDRLPESYAEEGEAEAEEAKMKAEAEAKMADSNAAEEEAAAVHIQRVIRGKAARAKVAKLKADSKEKPSDDDEETRAALHMQRLARGKAARERVQRLREEREKGSKESESKLKAEREKRAEAAVEAELEAAAAEGATEEELASIQLQRIARGRRARVRVSTMKKEKEAAVNVTRIAKGRTARRRVAEMRKEKKAACEVQRMARGRLARKRVDALRRGDSDPATAADPAPPAAETEAEAEAEAEA